MEGVRQFTRMPLRDASNARVRLNISTPALHPPIIDSPGVAIFAASDDMFMIDPPSRNIIPGMAAWHMKSTLIKCA